MILFAPSLRGLKKRNTVNQERMSVKGERWSGKREIETKHINSGIGGAHRTHSVFFPREKKNNSSHECVPNESTTTSLNK